MTKYFMNEMDHVQCYRLKILNHRKFKDRQTFGSQLMCHPTNSMTGFLLSCMKVLTSALESALEQRVPLLGIARFQDYFQSKDRGRISQKKVLKKCSIMLCAFFQYSKSENLFFDGKSSILDLYQLFEKPQPGNVVRKNHQESEFSVGLVIKFHYQPQNDVKRLDDFHLIQRNSII